MSKTPKAPDPVMVAKMDQEGKQRTQQESMANQYDPFGNALTWTTEKDPVTGYLRNTSHQTFSKENQDLFNTGMATRGVAAQGAYDVLNNAGYGGAGDTGFDWDKANSLTSNLFNKHLSLVNPQQDQLQKQLDNRLRNQGILPGQPAYEQQMREFLLSRNQASNDFFIKDNQNAYNQAVQNYLRPMQVSQALSGAGQPNAPMFNQNAVRMGETNTGDIINAGFKNQLAASAQDPFSANNLMQTAGTVLGATMTGGASLGATLAAKAAPSILGAATGGGAAP